MKRIRAWVLLLLLALTLMGCTRDEGAVNTIWPHEFAEETQDVLRLFGDDLVFFDYAVDNTINYAAIRAWFYRDGEWKANVISHGEADDRRECMAVYVREDGYDLFRDIDADGFVRSGYSGVDTDFSKADGGIMTTRLSNATPIQEGEEITLFARLGYERESDQASVVMESPMDFRRADCVAGMAITITFSSDVAGE